MTMCFSKVPFLAVALGGVAIAAAMAEAPAAAAPKKPFAFAEGVVARPYQKVWSAVILASNRKKGERPLPAPPELEAFVPKLSSFFGYDQFEVLGSAMKVMDEQVERWLVPTQNFWLCARANQEAGTYRLKMELFHDKRRLLNAEAMLGPKSPLFIRGPMHPRGQVIIVFEVIP